MVIGQQEQVSEELLSARFTIDPDRLAARGRSLQLLLLHRRCAGCWGTIIQEPGGGMAIDVDEHLERIANHCSLSPEFIQSDMPSMEAAFRVLLSNGRKPMTLQAIYETLRERWSNPTNPRTPPPDKLYRMLLADTFYGITQLAEVKGK
ncbi:MAG: hypothetical protein Q7K03_02645 [Dehalococcoidia bacterium]|nr:hypothetical protein [Dehalococcoidia bacterium]